MGAGLVLFFWLIIATTIASILVVFYKMWRHGKNTKSPFLKWTGGIFLFVFSVSALSLVIVIVISLIRLSVPSFVYEDVFGEKPGDDVINLKTDTTAFGDYSHKYMSFKLSKDTFDRILPKDLVTVPYAKFEEEWIKGPDKNRPSWWLPLSASTTEIYMKTERFINGQIVGDGNVAMSYEEETGTAQYHYFHVD